MPIPFLPVAAVVAGGLTLVGVPAFIKRRDALAKANADAQLRAECETQRIALEQAVVAGHSPAEINQIRINLAACVRKAGTSGVDIGNTQVIGLLPCTLQRDYLERVFADYRNTAYTDSVSRDSKRGAIFSAGEEMVRCLETQLASATTRADVQTILTEINIAAGASRDRAVCYFEGGNGCGRFAENEQHGNERGMQEIERIGARLGSPWYAGYAALGFGERFRASANLQDRSRELAEGDYGGLRRLAEVKLASMPAPTLNAGVGSTLIVGRPGMLRGIRLSPSS